VGVFTGVIIGAAVFFAVAIRLWIYASVKATNRDT